MKLQVAACNVQKRGVRERPRQETGSHWSCASGRDRYRKKAATGAARTANPLPRLELPAKPT